MTRATWAANLCTLALLSAHVAFVLVALLLSPLMAHATPTETCLTGTAPDVVNDASQIRAVRALIETGCTCSSYDGTKAHTHTNYVLCAANIIKAQATLGHLRTQCKATVKTYYRRSTCGRNPIFHTAPCIQRSVKTGAITCVITATTKKDGVTPSACATTTKVARVSCPAFTQCIDAADTNGNLIIAAPGDSGGCVIPTATPTTTFTETAPLTPTPTPTLTATVPATQTETATPTPAETPTAMPSVTPTPTETPDPCLIAHALTLPPTIDMIWVEETPAVLDGVTPITIEGSVDNIAQAFWSDPRQCASDPPPTFHWVINTPLVTGYTARGISGYRADILSIEADSIPKFEPNTITFTFTVTSQVPNPSGTLFSTSKTFRALYRNSALLIGMSTTCQTMQETGSGCDIEAALAVLPGTPT